MSDLIRAATVLIIENDLILAVSRKDDLNDWGLCGGKVESNETYGEAAVRELKEETGLVAFADDMVYTFERQDGNFIVRTFMVIRYTGKLSTDEEQVAKGEGRVKFVTKEELMSGSFGKYNRSLLEYLGMV